MRKQATALLCGSVEKYITNTTNMLRLYEHQMTLVARQESRKRPIFTFLVL